MRSGWLSAALARLDVNGSMEARVVNAGCARPCSISLTEYGIYYSKVYANDFTSVRVCVLRIANGE